jgi:hypothetical protein
MASRLLRERRFEAAIAADTERSVARPVRSVTFNAAESPLGWLFARDLITQRQFDAGERLRGLGAGAAFSASDDGLGRRTGGAGTWRLRGSARPQWRADRRQAQIQRAVASAGPGLADILWRIVCDGQGMREAESALGWPARAGKLVLTFALDRVADYYRIR